MTLLRAQLFTSRSN